MTQKISEQELVDVISELFEVREKLTLDSDLSRYVKDSIDLGELIAVTKEKYGAEPRDIRLFNSYVKLGDVLRIFNGEL